MLKNCIVDTIMCFILVLQDHLLRWGVWITVAVISVILSMVAIALVGSG